MVFTDIPLYKDDQIHLYDVFDRKKKYLFLVGAGISFDFPSNLPLSKKVVSTILSHITITEEYGKLSRLMKEGRVLRFEILMNILQETIDPDLSLLKIYALCDYPNKQHYFLAEMIKEGHIVLTTNFDHLIEQALIKSGISKNEIKLFLTDIDYEKREEYVKFPYKLFELHGTVKNIISGKVELQTISASLNQIGKGRGLFQIEEGKKQLLEYFLDSHDCIIMGYSGWDDFDIIPILENFQTDSKRLIWIKHSKTTQPKEQKIMKINPEYVGEVKLTSTSKCDQILYEIVKNRKRSKDFVYKIETSTSDLIEEFFVPEFINNKKFTFKTALKGCNIELKKNIRSNENYQISTEIKYFITGMIYQILSLSDKALDIWERGRIYCENRKNEYWLGQHLKNLAVIYYSRQDFDKSLDYNIKALRIYERLKALPIGILENLGRIYHDLGDIQKAYEYYNTALKLATENNLKKQEGAQLANIGHIYNEQGKCTKALECYNKA